LEIVPVALPIGAAEPPLFAPSGFDVIPVSITRDVAVSPSPIV
jgi:hypothetical protein